jgi:hypothetical protein
MKYLENILAIAGALSIVVGVGMFRLAAGVITLGVLLILGAVAVSKDFTRADAGAKKAGN